MLENLLKEALINIFSKNYQLELKADALSFQKTRPEFEGDLTLVVFPFLKLLRKKPEELAKELGESIMLESPLVHSFNVIKGFLNLVINDRYWFDFLEAKLTKTEFGQQFFNPDDTVVIEYSSPNTNKPLHLGHVRNNLLGWSVAEILRANGANVLKVNLVNDRGIHISKSMLAWQRWANDATPTSTNKKGDKLVGELYVEFDKAYKAEQQQLIQEGISEDEAKKKAPLIVAAQQMLREWEAGEADVKSLWQTMNGWVYEGFEQTYKRMGIDFDKIYYESETYLLGKQLVLEGLAKGVFYKKEDGSVWCDLTDEGLDEKLLLRADGTSVYMTQDLGTAQLRYDEFKAKELIYVVGNEQNYHFEVLQKVLKRLGKPWADGIEHLSYGMVELPDGKMKLREGTVVDADELMEEMVGTAKKMSEELGKGLEMETAEAQDLYEMIGMAALKYFILRVDPKKTMLFNPAESIDFNGNTGPFVQYTHARIKSVLRKAQEQGIKWSDVDLKPLSLKPKEKSVITLLYTWKDTLQQAAINRSPALIANFLYELAREYNQFYQEHSILKETDKDIMILRLKMSDLTVRMLSYAAGLLGIQMPEKM